MWATFASISITLVMLAYNQPFDVDGIGLLKAAAVFTHQGIKQAVLIYRWPLYPILIASVANIFHLSLLHSAYFLNAILDTVTVVLFIMLVKELGGTRRLQIIAAFVILFFPYLNHFRHNVLRGHGYYAFALLAILFLIYYCRSYQWRYAIGWGLAVILATLFRIEGAVLACFLPLILLFKPGQKFILNLKYITQAYIVHFFVIALILIYSFIVTLSHPSGFHIPYLSRLSEFIYQMTNGMQNAWHVLQAKAAAMKSIGIWPEALYRGVITYFLTGGLIAVYIGLLIATFGLLYLILSIYSLTRKIIPFDWSTKAVWTGAILLNVIVTVVFLCQQFFLSYRYIALLCLLLLLSIPFALEKLYINWKARRKLMRSRWMFPLVCLGLMYTVIGSVTHFGPSKTYIIKAGQWIDKNTFPISKLCCNDEQLFYYANRRGLNAADFSQNQKQCDYLALKITKHEIHDNKYLKYLEMHPIKLFHNERGDKVLIFKLK
ncbi:MAG: hypothetical protein AMJ43_03670 [Coxiella sp. DG_40]|nr:MAG: hypothetical protein AMJ43_03670 [Coxiella sp. DG_40]